MKIALLCDWFLPKVGGIELHLNDLARGLAGRGHDVRVLATCPGPAQVDGIAVERLPGLRMPRWGFSLCDATTRAALLAAIARHGSEVVHAHGGTWTPAGYGGAWLCQRRGVPTVLTVHSVLDGLGPVLPALAAVIGSAGWNLTWSAVGEDVARSLRPHVGGRPVRLLPNAVDDAFWRAGAVSAARGATVEVVAVMRLTRRKRGSELLRAFARARAASRVPIRLTLVGDGFERGRLETLARRLALGPSARILGFRPRPEVRDLLACSDVFVLPSTRESFGIAALEARCAGLPVVTYRRSGAARFLEHERSALLVDDDAGLTAALVRLAEDGALRQRLRAHNTTAPNPYPWPAVLDAHEQAYRDALAGR
ncbi:MAG: glycosyltransferase family 4 protein [Vicinamibacteria bacterium]|nr:glycosyltransferase family 4 protein [Vicinamibacteria bacterium]